jgi:TPR repeat protein
MQLANYNFRMNNNAEQHLFNYVNNHKKNSQEIYNLLLNNSNNFNSIYLLKYFNFYEIETNINAINLYIKAANLGNNIAQYNLALMYENRNGIKKDLKQATYWYEKSAKQKNQNAKDKLKNIFSEKVIDELFDFILKETNKGIEEYITKQHIIDYINNQKIDLQETYNWLVNNQDKSNPVFLFGYFNYHGIKTNVNKQKAFELYQQAFELNQKMANLGDSVAQYNLDLMYENGDGIEKDSDKATYWYKKSAEQGNQDAQRIFENFINR